MALAKDSPLRALLVVLATAVVCSAVVSTSVELLRPIQLDHRFLERGRSLLALTGLATDADRIDDSALLRLLEGLDARVVDIDSGEFDLAIDPYSFDSRPAAADPALGVAIAAEVDAARLGRRSRHAPVFLVWRGKQLDRVILPVSGSGMWSMIQGYVALEADFNTVAGVIFTEQNETPGLGDQITQDYWQAQWAGKRLYDDSAAVLFQVAEGLVAPGSAVAAYQVDALTGATVTANAVSALIRYWFGPAAYGPLLARWRAQPPRPPRAAHGQER